MDLTKYRDRYLRMDKERAGEVIRHSILNRRLMEVARGATFFTQLQKYLEIRIAPKCIMSGD